MHCGGLTGHLIECESQTDGEKRVRSTLRPTGILAAGVIASTF